MGFFHVNTFVFIWSTCDHCDKLLLSSSLLLHINICEEWTCDWVTKHILIKLVNNSIDGWFSTESLKKSLIGCLFYGDNVVFCRIKYLSYFENQIFRNFIKPQSLKKVFPSIIEIFFGDFHFLMGSFHIFAFIVMRSSGYHRDKLFLPHPLLIHIGILEKVVYFRVNEHKFIEFINNSVDSICSAEFIKKSCHFLKMFFILQQSESQNIQRVSTFWEITTVWAISEPFLFFVALLIIKVFSVAQTSKLLVQYLKSFSFKLRYLQAIY